MSAAQADAAGQLFVQLAGETVRLLTLDMTLLSVGRTPDNGLALPHPSVAIRHAEVRRAGEQVVITDLGAGDTFVGGRRLAPHQPQVLEAGVAAQIGPYVVTYLQVAHLSAPFPVGDSLLMEAPTGVRFVPPKPPRAKLAPELGPPHVASTYLRYLPALFAESDFLGRYLSIFEQVWEPLQRRQDFLELYFDPATCPETFLGYLARWLGLTLDAHWPESRRRAWLLEAAQLYRWRGTRYGLTRTLEVCCGVTPRVTEDAGRPHHLLIVLPTPQEDEDSLTQAAIEAVLDQHVPAHVTYEVRYV